MNLIFGGGFKLSSPEAVWLKYEFRTFVLVARRELLTFEGDGPIWWCVSSRRSSAPTGEAHGDIFRSQSEK